MIFHVGCGGHLWPYGFPKQEGEKNIRIDVRESIPRDEISIGKGPIYPTNENEARQAMQPDYIAHCCELDSVTAMEGRPDKIAAEDLLEHMPFREALEALQHWCGILKKHGCLHVRVPDIEGLALAYAGGKLIGPRLVRRLYGDQDYELNVHKSGWTTEMLKDALVECGFNTPVIESREPWNLWAWCFKE